MKFGSLNHKNTKMLLQVKFMHSFGEIFFHENAARGHFCLLLFSGLLEAGWISLAFTKFVIVWVKKKQYYCAYYPEESDDFHAGHECKYEPGM